MLAAPSSSALHNCLPFLIPTFEITYLLESGSIIHSSNTYKYKDIQTIESSYTHLPPLNTVPPASANVSTYGHYSNSVAVSLLEAQPYYPSYLSY